MTLLEKRDQILDLIKDELAFVTEMDEDPFKPDYKIFLPIVNLKRLGLMYDDCVKILTKLKEEKLITSFELSDSVLENNRIEKDGLNLVVDREHFLQSIQQGFIFDFNKGTVTYKTHTVKFQAGSYQYRILSLLFSQIGNIFSFPDIAAAMGESISKSQEKRIRDLIGKISSKIREAGIDKDLFISNNGYGIVK